MRRIVVALIRGYQLLVSPMLPPACRFYPSCSRYAVEAVERYGVVQGGWLAIRRLARCHPFHPGGIDPVPVRGAPATGSLGRGEGSQSGSGLLTLAGRPATTPRHPVRG